MSGDRWYVYRLMPGSEFDVYRLDRDTGFSSKQQASDWIFKQGHITDRPGRTFQFRRIEAGKAPALLSMADEREGWKRRELAL